MTAGVVDDVLRILRRADDSDLVDAVQVVAELCDVPAAAITVEDGDCFHLPVTYGIPPMVCDASDTFCQKTMSTDEVFLVPDATQDERFCDIGWTNGTLAEVRFYASAPIRAPGGRMVGRLCIADMKPRTLTSLQTRALETLASNISSLIELRLLHHDLGEPNGSERPADVMRRLKAELSHDLKVPLSAIRASLEMLGDELHQHPDPAVRALLDRSSRAADRMWRMLEQHLRSVPSSETEQLEVTKVDLYDVARQVAVDFAPRLELQRATLIVDGLPAVQGHADEMYSVLQNLIGNALKYARPGVPPRISVHATMVPGAARVSVIDNGIGIPAHRRSSVFELYTRGETSVAGHGIGLATVARIVRERGGRVGADEAPGGGAAVWFELPTS